MQLSAKGLQFLKNAEGFRAKPYLCSAGKLTVGYGHVIQPGEDFSQPITREEAHNLLLKDIGPRLFALQQSVRTQLTQSQVDALISLMFNIGIADFKRSTLVRKLNSRDYKGAANEFERWNKITDPKTKQLVPCDGLTSRRKKEKALFETKPEGIQ